MAEQLKVVSAPEQKKQITVNNSPLIVWTFDVQRGQNGDGEKVSVELLKRPGNAPPGEGSTVLGDLSQNDYGWKLKLPNEGGGGGRAGRSPADTKAIQRQHSQEMAIRALVLANDLGVDLAVDGRDGFFQKVQDTTDWFERDIGGSNAA